MPIKLIGGIPTANVDRAKLAGQMLADCHLARSNPDLPPKLLFSSNGSVIARYHTDKSFKKLIDQADIIDADGMPLVIATRLFCRNPLTERVATTDFIHDASALAAEHGVRFYFLGGKPGVAEIAAAKLRVQNPDLQIVGVRDGYFSKDEEDQVLSDIVEKKTDVLWIGMGSPHQEAFAVRVRERLRGVAWIKTCGGLFDHTAGSVKRAPKWMQDMSLEWLHRMLLEPKRLGWRYLTSNPVALFHLLTKTRDMRPQSDQRRGTSIGGGPERNRLGGGRLVYMSGKVRRGPPRPKRH